MKLALEAQWRAPEPWSDRQVLEIAALSASVWNQGDVWAWEVIDLLSPDGRPFMEGWAGDEAQAKKLAEEAISDYYARKEQ